MGGARVRPPVGSKVVLFCSYLPCAPRHEDEVAVDHRPGVADLLLEGAAGADESSGGIR